MPKDYPIKENIYLILLRYFNGEVVYLTDEKVKLLESLLLRPSGIFPIWDQSHMEPL